METLAQFKRDIKVGDKVELLQLVEHDYSTNTMGEIEIPEKIKGIREVTAISTVWFKLNKSYCEYPKASNFEYNKHQGTFKIVERKENGDIWQIRLYKIIK